MEIGDVVFSMINFFEVGIGVIGIVWNWWVFFCVCFVFMVGWLVLGGVCVCVVEVLEGEVRWVGGGMEVGEWCYCVVVVDLMILKW